MILLGAYKICCYFLCEWESTSRNKQCVIENWSRKAPSQSGVKNLNKESTNQNKKK